MFYRIYRSFGEFEVEIGGDVPLVLCRPITTKLVGLVFLLRIIDGHYRFVIVQLLPNIVWESILHSIFARWGLRRGVLVFWRGHRWVCLARALSLTCWAGENKLLALTVELQLLAVCYFRRIVAGWACVVDVQYWLLYLWV